MIDIAGIVTAGSVVGLLYGGAVLGLGAAFRLMRFPDITVEGSFVLGASLWAAAVGAGWPASLAAVAALVSGGLCGVTTAALHNLLGVDRFLAGILTTASCFSIALLILGTSNVGLFNAPSALGLSNAVDGWPLAAALIFAVLMSIAIAGYFSTAAGLRSRAASSNSGMFSRSIGHTFPPLAAGLAVTNGVVALSGVMFARYQGFVDVGMGQGVLITSLAALAIGEAVTRWWKIGPLNALLLGVWSGSILYQWALSTALSLGFPAATTKLVTALIVILFLALQHQKRNDSSSELAV
jgi:putative tryptophan/tyrosine transport system permease protein